MNNKYFNEQKHYRVSVLDIKIEDIKKLRGMGVSLASIHKIINCELPENGVTYSGFYRYCKRKNLIN